MVSSVVIPDEAFGSSNDDHKKKKKKYHWKADYAATKTNDAQRGHRSSKRLEEGAGSMFWGTGRIFSDDEIKQWGGGKDDKRLKYKVERTMRHPVPPHEALKQFPSDAHYKKAQKAKWKPKYSATQTDDVRHGHYPEIDSSEAFRSLSPMGTLVRSSQEVKRDDIYRKERLMRGISRETNKTADKAHTAGSSSNSNQGSKKQVQKETVYRPEDFKLSDGSDNWTPPDPKNLKISDNNSANASSDGQLHPGQSIRSRKSQSGKKSDYRKLRPGEKISKDQSDE